MFNAMIKLSISMNLDRDSNIIREKKTNILVQKSSHLIGTKSTWRFEIRLRARNHIHLGYIRSNKQYNLE
jgi:predicted secreted protein